MLLVDSSVMIAAVRKSELHYETALDAQTLLKKAVALERIVSLIGESELSSDDQVIFKRSKMLKNYMTQNFTVVETQTEKKGVYVSLKDTVTDVRSILDGKVDNMKPEDFLFIGTIKELDQKIASKKGLLPITSTQTGTPQISVEAGSSTSQANSSVTQNSNIQ